MDKKSLINEIESLKKELKRSKDLLFEVEKIGKLGHYELDFSTGIWTTSLELDRIFGIPITSRKTIDSWTKIVVPEHRGMMQKYFQEEVIEKHLPFNKKYKIICVAEKSIKWVHGRGILTKNNDGSLKTMFGTIIDITDVKEKQQKLEIANEIITKSPASFFVWKNQRKWSTLQVSGNFETIFGYTENEFVSGKISMKDFIYFEDLARVKAENEEIAISDKNNFRHQPYRIVTKNGTLKWVDDQTTIIRHQNPDEIIYQEVIIDISELMNVQTELNDTKEKLQLLQVETQSILDNIPAMVYVKDTQNKFVRVNKYLSNAYNLEKEDMEGKYIGDFIPKEMADFSYASDIKIMNTRIPLLNNEERWNYKGEEFWISTSKIPYTNKNDEVIGILGFSIDITEKVIAQKNLFRHQSVFETMFRSISDAIIITNPKREIRHANISFTKLFGYTEEEIIGQTTDLIYFSKENFIDKSKTLFNKSSNKPGELYPMKYITKKGRVFIGETFGTKMYDENNEVLGFLGVIRDITDREEAEKKIINEIIKTEEKERNRFAQDLHDGLGPLISTIKLYIQWIGMPDATADKIMLADKAQETCEIAYQSLREISNNLSPHILQNFGLSAALRTFLKRLNFGKSVKINYTTNFEQRIDQTAETILYRVVTECLNNTIKHAQATIITITINYKNKELSVYYADNGIGFDIESARQAKVGFGIFNIFSRLKSIGAASVIQSTPEKGMWLQINLPITEFFGEYDII